MIPEMCLGACDQGGMPHSLPVPQGAKASQAQETPVPCPLPWVFQGHTPRGMHSQPRPAQPI